MDNGKINFVIPGAAVAKGRPRFARRGAFVSTYTDTKTASYENLVKVSAQSAMKAQQPTYFAVCCVIEVEVIPPASWSRKKRLAAFLGDIRPTSKPDLDNVAKGIFDAMNGIVWMDDKQVVEMVVRKRYSEMAQSSVEVRVL